VILVDFGGIVDHHSMSWSERWFFLYWWNCWHHSMSWCESRFKNPLSPQLIEWW
jgi:hypothetical protein